MNIVGFSGSPRKSGSTAVAVNKILGVAGEQGASTHMFSAGELEIKPCQACQGCAKGGGCVIQDDMQPIYAALKTADALVLGSPIYMGQMNAQAKAFTDRLYAHFKPRFSPAFQEEYAGKKLILVWTQGNPDGDMFKEYRDYTKKMFAMLEFDVCDVIVVAGTRSAASEQSDLDEKLKRAGVELAKAEG
ncbi:flavodoxin family protein [Clostridia bacterium]|nr:flavodoxin family protein [Clostridia bacterium]